MESALNMKFDEAEMLEMLGHLLMPGERLKAAVYCIYKDTGFFASNSHVRNGYVGITDANRLIGWQIGMLNTSEFALDMIYLTKMKISNVIFGQKAVFMEFRQDKKTSIKFQYGPKILGAKFPNQKENAEILLNELQARQNMLKN